MFATLGCCQFCHHPLGFPHPREETEGCTLDTIGCGFPWTWGYNESQVLGRQIPPIGQAGNQFPDQGPRALSALTLMDLKGRRMRASPWGCPGQIPAPCTAIPHYDIKSQDSKAPIHPDHCGGNQCHQSRDRESPTWGIRMDYRSLPPPWAREVNRIS